MANAGERIRQRRLELGLSVEEIAKYLGKNKATIYRYENGDIKNFPVSIMKPLTEILEITSDLLMEWIEADKTKEKSVYNSLKKKG